MQDNDEMRMKVRNRFRPPTQEMLHLYDEYEKAFFGNNELLKTLNFIEKVSRIIEVGERILAQMPFRHFMFEEIAHFLSTKYDERAVLFRYHSSPNPPNYSRAIADFTRAIDLSLSIDEEPDERIYRWRCECYVRAARPSEALKDVELLLQKAQDSDFYISELYILRSQCYQMFGRYEQALDDATKALELAGSRKDWQYGSLLQRLSIYREVGNYIMADLDQNRINMMLGEYRT